MKSNKNFSNLGRIFRKDKLTDTQLEVNLKYIIKLFAQIKSHNHESIH